MAHHNYALIDLSNNIVMNIVVIDTDGDDIVEPEKSGISQDRWTPPQGHLARRYSGVVEIGYTYDPATNTYTKPAAEEPAAG
jgi:hypothetical protein